MSSASSPTQPLSPSNAVGMLWLNDQWQAIDANQAMLDMLQVDSLDELRGLKATDFIDQDFRELISHEQEKRRRGIASTYETVLVGRKGARRQIIISAAPLLLNGVLTGVVATHVDVTPAREAERALLATMERYRAVVSALGDGVFVVARDGQILEANASAARILGVPHDRFENIAPRETQWQVRDEHGRRIGLDQGPATHTLITGTPCRNVVLQLERPDGSSVWISVNTEPLFEPGEPAPQAVVVSFHDITELKKSHRELSIREARLSRLLDAVPDLLFLLSHDGVYLDYRASRPELLFVPPERFLGRSMSDVLPPEVLGPCQVALRRACESGQTQTVEYDSDYNGIRQYFEARMSPYDEKTVLMIVRDVTEARMAEARLQQVERERAHLARLGALGEMVAGISHEINQPLHAIANFAAASLNMLPSDAQGTAQVRQWLQKIAEQAFRASQIVRRFRQFSSPVASVEATPVRDLVNEAIELAAGEARRKNISISLVNEAGTTRFRCDRIQIQQVLVNFLVNAIDALEHSLPKDREIRVVTRFVSGKLWCEVIDNGCGLPNVPSTQLFDPFFTTKPQGLGLGLAISRTIVEAHHGRIWARVNNPRGAAFGFEVPESRDAG